MHTGGRQNDCSLVGVRNRDEDGARRGHVGGGTELGLGECRWEVTVDAHDLARGTHLGAKHGVDDLAASRAEALEGKDRSLDSNRSAVTNRAGVLGGQQSLLAQRSDRFAHLDERRCLRELNAGCLRGEGHGARGTGVGLDDVKRVGEQRELDVDQATHADATRDGLGRGRNTLELARGQRHGRQHAGGVTRVDTRLLDVLHDRAHEQLFTVVQGVHVDLDGCVQESVDEERATGEE